MRRAARTDGNHAAIVAALRKIGATAFSLAAVGNGCPDMVVGYRGVNLLLEVKDGARPPSERSLTAAQKEFFAAWAGQAAVVISASDAVTFVVETLRPRPKGKA